MSPFFRKTQLPFLAVYLLDTHSKKRSPKMAPTMRPTTTPIEIPKTHWSPRQPIEKVPNKRAPAKPHTSASPMRFRSFHRTVSFGPSGDVSGVPHVQVKNPSLSNGADALL